MKISMIISAALLVGATAFAADTKHETTTDTSKNPVTGTETAKTEEVHKDGDNKMKKTTKKKTHKDGSTKETVETKTETAPTH